MPSQFNQEQPLDGVNHSSGNYLLLQDYRNLWDM
jgi:hypothetical protein